MIIRPATQSDFKSITTIHTQSWKDSYSDVFPAEYLSCKIDRDIEDHWRNIEIQNEDIVLVAEEKILVSRPKSSAMYFGNLNSYAATRIFCLK